MPTVNVSSAGSALPQESAPPVMYEATADATDRTLDAIANQACAVECAAVEVKCPSADDSGNALAAGANLLVGVKNTADGRGLLANTVWGVELKPGDPPYLVTCTNTNQVHFRRQSGTSSLIKAVVVRNVRRGP